MTKEFEIYKCNLCGNIVSIRHQGNGQLLCCSQPMILQKENKDNKELEEKHLPIVQRINSMYYLIKIGEEPHPMSKEHYIQWVEITLFDGNVVLKKFTPNEEPEMVLETRMKIKYVKAYCNLHGLWINYNKIVR